jgi:hypothetical protein
MFFKMFIKKLNNNNIKKYFLRIINKMLSNCNKTDATQNAKKSNNIDNVKKLDKKIKDFVKLLDKYNIDDEKKKVMIDDYLLTFMKN